MKKILVIEDEPDLIKALDVRLKQEGFGVLTAFDGEEGLNKARQEKPDLIILDVMLPKLDGYKVSRLLKSDERYKDIPIIMLTVRYHEEDKIKGFKAGADEYVTKPFEWEGLLKKMQKYVKPGATILVTDDEPDLVKALEIRFLSRGYRVITASNGKECLKMAEEFHPDLITLDILMPEMDGFEACRRLRKDLKLDTPIIMLSVKSQPADRLKGLEMGADVYMTKPFNNEELLHQIHAQLGLHSAN